MASVPCCSLQLRAMERRVLYFLLNVLFLYQQTKAVTKIVRRSAEHRYFVPTRNIPYWENGLREASFQVLLRQYHKAPNLRNYIRTAPIIGRQDNATPFGDIAVLARGQLYSTPEGFIFVQDPYQNDCEECHSPPRECKRNCQVWKPQNHEKLIALWTVKRIRHRDASGGFQYELKYIISPVNKTPNKLILRRDGQFDYNLPGHVFLLRSGQNQFQELYRGTRPASQPWLQNGNTKEEFTVINFAPSPFTPHPLNFGDFFLRNAPVPFQKHYVSPPFYPSVNVAKTPSQTGFQVEETPLAAETPTPHYSSGQITPKSKSDNEAYQNLLKAFQDKTTQTHSQVQSTPKFYIPSTSIDKPVPQNNVEMYSEKPVLESSLQQSTTTTSYPAHVKEMHNILTSTLPKPEPVPQSKLPSVSQDYSKTTKYASSDIWSSEPMHHFKTSTSQQTLSQKNKPLNTQITKAIISKITTSTSTTTSPIFGMKKGFANYAATRRYTTRPQTQRGRNTFLIPERTLNVPSVKTTTKTITQLNGSIRRTEIESNPFTQTSEKLATTETIKHDSSPTSTQIQKTLSASGTDKTAIYKVIPSLLPGTTKVEIVPITKENRLFKPILNVLKPILGTTQAEDIRTPSSKIDNLRETQLTSNEELFAITSTEHAKPELRPTTGQIQRGCTTPHISTTSNTNKPSRVQPKGNTFFNVKSIEIGPEGPVSIRHSTLKSTLLRINTPTSTQTVRTTLPSNTSTENDIQTEMIFLQEVNSTTSEVNGTTTNDFQQTDMTIESIRNDTREKDENINIVESVTGTLIDIEPTITPTSKVTEKEEPSTLTFSKEVVVEVETTNSTESFNASTTLRTTAETTNTNVTLTVQNTVSPQVLQEITSPDFVKENTPPRASQETTLPQELKTITPQVLHETAPPEVLQETTTPKKNKYYYSRKYNRNRQFKRPFTPKRKLPQPQGTTNRDRIDFEEELFGIQKTTSTSTPKSHTEKAHPSNNQILEDIFGSYKPIPETEKLDTQDPHTSTPKIIFSNFYFAPTESPLNLSSSEEQEGQLTKKIIEAEVGEKNLKIEKLNITTEQIVEKSQEDIPTSQSVSTSVSFVINKTNKTRNLPRNEFKDATMLKAMVEELKYDNQDVVVYKAEFPDIIDIDSDGKITHVNNSGIAVDIESTEPDIKKLLSNITLSIVNHARALDLLQLEENKKSKSKMYNTTSGT